VTGCDHVAVVSPCDDLNRCTTEDTCVAGACRGLALDGCARVCGDADGDGEVNIRDALATLKMAIAGTPCDPLECDVDASGRVTVNDALLLLQIVVGVRDPETCRNVDGGTGSETEPNDTTALANPISCPITLAAAIGSFGDGDYFALGGVAGEWLVIDIDAYDNGSSLDSFVQIFDSREN
jgi:hypothetical protein